MKPIQLKKLFILMYLIIGWMAINFNFELAMIYAVMLTACYIIIDTYGTTPLRFEKDENRLIDLMFGVVGYAVYLFSALAIGIITNTGDSLQSAFTLIEAVQPIFANSPYFSILGWGFVVPFIETILIGLLIPIVGRWFKSDLNLKSARTHLVFIILSVGAVLFHLTTRATLAATGEITFKPAGLYLTFTFFYLSCMMIVWLKEIMPAAWTHAIANTLAVASKFSLGFAVYFKSFFI